MFSKINTLNPSLPKKQTTALQFVHTLLMINDKRTISMMKFYSMVLFFIFSLLLIFHTPV
ncbi:hypothetical protein GCM10028819_43610 [Spirosoma humi]